MASMVPTLAWVAVCSGVLTCMLPAVSDAIGYRPDASHVTATRSPKGDRLLFPAPVQVMEIATVEISGPDGARDVTMRDATGAVVYRSVQAAALTRVAKGSQIRTFDAPLVVADRPVPVAAQRHVAREPARRHERSVRRRIPVGCDRLVSPLVRPVEAVLIGRCIT